MLHPRWRRFSSNNKYSHFRHVQFLLICRKSGDVYHSNNESRLIFSLLALVINNTPAIILVSPESLIYIYLPLNNVLCTCGVQTAHMKPVFRTLIIIYFRDQAESDRIHKEQKDHCLYMNVPFTTYIKN